jgi:hypothetical protein
MPEQSNQGCAGASGAVKRARGFAAWSRLRPRWAAKGGEVRVRIKVTEAIDASIGARGIEACGRNRTVDASAQYEALAIGATP